MSVNPIPAGYHTVTPYFIAKNARSVIDFMVKAFDAKDMGTMEGPNGSIMHASLKIGDSMVMISDANEKAEPNNVMVYLYVPDVDATYKQAIEAGGVSLQVPVDMFYGDRSGAVADPAGNPWWIATHVKDVTHDELAKAAPKSG